VGAPAPGFELPALSGTAVALGDLRGRVVFVNFWATWCPPCREEAPALERLYRRLRGEGFEVVGVSIDDPSGREAVERFRDEFSLSFPLLVDPDRSAYRAYQATGVPETFVVDRSGRLAERFVGPRDWDEPRYANAVRTLLAAGGGRCEGAAC
jgi:peroxiredoxin